MSAVPAPLPPNEQERLDVLYLYNILDTLPEQAYDDITQLAAHICDTPISLVSLIDRNRQWFKSRFGLEATETSRDIAFCAYAILQNDPMVVPNAQEDPRFAGNPLVVSTPNIRFYAGVPLVTPTNFALGTLCVIDRVPRGLSDEQATALAALARQVVSQLELRLNLSRLGDANARLTALAETDGLTGIYNHRTFQERLDVELKNLAQFCMPLSLLVLDIDHFKTYNDSFGHLAGDEVLRNVAQLLVENARLTDFVARYGGEEFVVILPNTDSAAANQIGERFRAAIANHSWSERPISASIGHATITEPVHDRAFLIIAADRAMYASKAAGRNRVTAFSDTTRHFSLVEETP